MDFTAPWVWAVGGVYFVVVAVALSSELRSKPSLWAYGLAFLLIPAAVLNTWLYYSLLLLLVPIVFFQASWSNFLVLLVGTVAWIELRYGAHGLELVLLGLVVTQTSAFCGEVCDRAFGRDDVRTWQGRLATALVSFGLPALASVALPAQGSFLLAAGVVFSLAGLLSDWLTARNAALGAQMRASLPLLDRHLVNGPALWLLYAVATHLGGALTQVSAFR